MVNIKVRYIFYGLFTISIIASILTGKSSVGNLLGLGILTYVLYFTNKIEAEYTSDGTLTGSEKASVIITTIFNPLVAQAFYYYCWKKKFPIRASQANKYGWITFGIEFSFFIVATVLLTQFVIGPKRAGIH